MEFLTNEKLTIVGAAGMIGSNMAQTAIMMHLTPNICLYDPFAPALEGVAEEMYHCGFEGVNITWTTDVKEALTGASYVVSSGGAARKAGMTREDLLKGNAQIAEEFGKNLKAYCPDVKHVVVIFNPADITGLITLIYSGLKPSQLTTLAALDSTRLRSELAKYFKISPDEVRNCRTFGGHGEQMAVFASTTMVAGKPLSELIGKEMPEADWEALQQRVIQGGKHIIDLRGRSSFQSPAYVSICMIAAAMGGKPFEPHHDGHGDRDHEGGRSLQGCQGYSRGAQEAARELRAPCQAARRGDRNGSSARHRQVGRAESEPQVIGSASEKRSRLPRVGGRLFRMPVDTPWRVGVRAGPKRLWRGSCMETAEPK